MASCLAESILAPRQAIAPGAKTAPRFSLLQTKSFIEFDSRQKVPVPLSTALQANQLRFSGVQMITRFLLFALFMFALPTVAALAQDPVPIYPDNYKVLLENERVRVVDFKLRKGAKEDFHSHPAAVTHVLTPFKIRFTFPDGTTRIREAKAGDVFFGEALTHASENIGDTDAHGLLIELKTLVSISSEAELLTAVTFIRGPENSESELLRELHSTTAPTRAEIGNLKYDLYQSTVDKDHFMRFEVWQNPEALEVHKQTPHLKASFERRKDKGWKTEITTWRRVEDSASNRQAAGVTSPTANTQYD
jgi:quinol monooxygenase YgiN/quercetin dioxygenase-like cupin family protein